MLYLKKNYNAKHAAKILAQHGYSRVPIVDDKLEVIGLLYAKDLLGKRKGLKIQSIMRSPYFVSGDCDVTKAFDDMNKRRVHMSIVRDNQGKHIGIITLEDILEELVGEIYDEYSEIKQGLDSKKKNV